MPEKEILDAVRSIDNRLIDVANEIGRWLNGTDRKILARLDRLEKRLNEVLERLPSK